MCTCEEMGSQKSLKFTVMYPYYDRNLRQWKKGTWTKTIRNTARRGEVESLMEERLQTGADCDWEMDTEGSVEQMGH